VKRLASLWRNLTRQRAVEEDLSDELKATFDLLLEEKLAAGMSPGEARRRARLELGSEEALKDGVRDVRQGASLDLLLQDTRYAFRQFRRSRGFALVAIVTLAFGIGANAAIFGVLKSLFLDALPYRDADRLVRVYQRPIDGTSGRPGWRAEVADRIRASQSSLDLLAAFDSPRDAAYGADGGTQIVRIQWVEPLLFRTLGVEAALGRTLNDDDRAVGHVPANGAERGPDTARSVMITHDAWRRLFGEDPGVLGREVRVNGLPRSIIGVLPRGFAGPAGPVDFYLGFDLKPAIGVGAGWLGLVGRLKPGVSAETARRDFEAIALAGAARSAPSAVAEAVLLRDAMVGATRTPLLVLLASAGLVLLIACTNLAGVLLSRSLSRRRELAVRVAMGAGRGRIIRQLLTESVWLALLGGVAGLVIAQVSLLMIRSLAAPMLPPFVALSLDPAVIAIAALVALTAGIGLGVVPAVGVSRADPQSALRDDARASTEGRRSRQTRGVLMAAQISVCAALLSGAGLLGRSLWAMATRPLGFDSSGVLAATVNLLPKDYPTLASRSRFHQQWLDRVRTLPGVEGVAIANKVPTVNPRRDPLRKGSDPDTASRSVVYASVSDGYFEALRIPILEGRTFEASEREGAPLAVVISESLRRREWPVGGAIGAPVRLGGQMGTVVGIVGDVRNDLGRTDSEPQAYMSHRQESTGRMCLLLRTKGDPLSYIKPVQRELAALDPTIPITRAGALSTMVGEVLAARQLTAILVSAFGVLALGLASIGVYSMFASMAAARRREFGVRLALGSRPGAIAALILRQGAFWMAVGLAGGVLGIGVVVNVLRGWLFGVAPFDPIALGGSMCALLVCAALALLIPVRRAVGVDPITVLRAE
jgi:putative ABC transport system permease protein